MSWNQSSLKSLINDIPSIIAENYNLFWPWGFKTLIENANDITYTTNTTLTTRVIVANTITINPGVVVTTMTGGVILICNKLINYGTITASGKGSAGGAAGSGGGSDTNGNNGSNAGQIDGAYVVGGSAGAGGRCNYYSGPSAGGNGGASRAGNGGVGSSSTTGGSGLDDSFYPIDIRILMKFILAGLGAAGGGAGGFSMAYSSGIGGAGGGSILILCQSLANYGSIIADGLNGGNATYATIGAGGGGAGGCVIIDCFEIVSKGIMTANGGATGVVGYPGGDGGDGTVALIERKAA